MRCIYFWELYREEDQLIIDYITRFLLVTGFEFQAFGILDYILPRITIKIKMNSTATTLKKSPFG